jgi:hypothetical protein
LLLLLLVVTILGQNLQPLENWKAACPLSIVVITFLLFSRPAEIKLKPVIFMEKVK